MENEKLIYKIEALIAKSKDSVIKMEERDFIRELFSILHDTSELNITQLLYSMSSSREEKLRKLSDERFQALDMLFVMVNIDKPGDDYMALISSIKAVMMIFPKGKIEGHSASNEKFFSKWIVAYKKYRNKFDDAYLERQDCKEYFKLIDSIYLNENVQS